MYKVEKILLIKDAPFQFDTKLYNPEQSVAATGAVL